MPSALMISIFRLFSELGRVAISFFDLCVYLRGVSCDLPHLIAEPQRKNSQCC